MRAGDVVSLPQLRCTVAQDAVAAWHDDIKNGLLWFSDDRLLEKRVHDGEVMASLEERVHHVCRDIRGFSGALLVSDLTPLARLNPDEKTLIERTLHGAFEDGFRPSEVAQVLETKLELLLQLLSGFTGIASGPKAERTPYLNNIRAAAQTLGVLLAGLPRGYWLPRTPGHTTQEVGP